MARKSQSSSGSPGAAETPPGREALIQPQLGRELRTLRRSRGLSITQVADASGISASFLALLEKGQSDVSIGRLMRLTAFYGVGLADVLPHPFSTENPEVIRKGKHRVIPSPGEQMEIVILTNDGNRVMRPVVGVLEPGGHTSEYLRQEGEVFIYVLEGELTIEVEGQAPDVLKAGDSAYMASGTPRGYRNEGRSRAKYLGVLANSAGEPVQARAVKAVRSV